MYNYETEKANLFTEENSIIFTKIRDNVKNLLSEAGAFQMGHAWSGVSGDTFTFMACIDRLVELNEIKEVTAPNSCWGQHRVFVKAGN